MYATQSHADSHFIPGPAFEGSCGYDIRNNRVIINIARIVNNRRCDNLSGTLSIELWALKQPYQGADFNGVALAGTRIGEVFGQHYLADCRYDLDFLGPSVGTWHLTLMLREWTENGYVTRDYVNFANPYTVTSTPVVSGKETGNIINVSFSGQKSSSTAEKAKAAATRSATDEKSGSRSPSAEKPAKTAASANLSAGIPAKNEQGVSVNTANLKEIASIKGVSKKLAENILSARPFESLEDVLKVKGMGPKLFNSIRKFITL